MSALLTLLLLGYSCIGASAIKCRACGNPECTRFTRVAFACFEDRCFDAAWIENDTLKSVKGCLSEEKERYWCQKAEASHGSCKSCYTDFCNTSLRDELYELAKSN